jgi:hypothetical protein
MQKIKQKRIWIQPELKILVKGETEEAVLGMCKNTGSIWEGGPLNRECRNFSIGDFICHQNSNS